MPRHLLAAPVLAFALVAAPTVAAAQASTHMDQFGQPMLLDNTPGGNSVYATLLAQSPDETFQALQVVYANLKIPTTVIDPGSHVIGTKQWNVPHRLGGKELSRYFDCGSGRDQTADDMTIHLTIQSTIKADSGHTTLSTTLNAIGNSNIEAARQIPCQTTGELETRISNDVVKLLGTK
jgi:hypothetical protein